ncbi:serine O-acetyltransferase [Singulisphaera sp. PoT]|uniref:serine O-acetyltransferase n=1 Tax=Singulisphaera sp. PoT TaxID=3411797 RepID=UPI003BF60936
MSTDLGPASTSTTSSQEPEPAWAEPEPGRPLPLRASLHDDLLAHVPPENREAGGLRWRLKLASIVVRSAGLHVMIVHRVSHTLVHRGGPPGKLASAFLFWWLRHFYGCSIAPTARLYGGVILPHPQGIVIGADVLTGPRAWIFQNVTMGGSPGKSGMPRLGRDGRIFAGAVLTGPIKLGDNVMVGANAVVHRDVPARTIARAVAVEYVPLPQAYATD